MKVVPVFILLLLSACAVSADRDYSAGEIQSKQQVQYGRFEVRMYSSDVSGTTSTFFLWKDGGGSPTRRWNELDIETFGKSANEWQSNPIWQYDDSDQEKKYWEEIHGGLPVANAWVVFTLEWTPDYIAWFNNGVEVRRINKGEDVPPEHHRYNEGNAKDPVTYIADPMRMAFNHWSTFPGDWLGPWNSADLPSFQFVDWVTYQAWNGAGFDAVSIRSDFNTLDDVTELFTISTHTFYENQCQFSSSAVGVIQGYLWLGIFPVGRERSPRGDELPGIVERRI